MTNSAPDLTLVSLLLVASLVSTRRVPGQEAERPPNADQPPAVSDSLPFRRGQWGAEFTIDNGTFGAGVLRFRSPSRAWLVDATFGANWAEFQDQAYQSGSVRVRAGPRQYRPLSAGAGGYLGMGLTGAYSWARDSDGFRDRDWDAGLFGHLGAAYFVTRRLSLSAQLEFFGTYRSSLRQYPSAPTRVRGHSVFFGVRPVQILGGLYF